MDLVAFAQIDDYQYLLDDLNLKIPRLRGIRDMSEEEKVDRSGFPSRNDILVEAARYRFAKRSYGLTIYGEKYDKLCDKYIKDNTVLLKKIYKKLRKKVLKEYGYLVYLTEKEYKMFNTYADKDVVYVHARIGYQSYRDTLRQLKQHPNFLGYCYDCIDQSYVDLYFKKAEKHNDEV